MNDRETFCRQTTTEGVTNAQTSAKRLRGGLDPAEMGRRSGQARRERKAREAEADQAREVEADVDIMVPASRAAMLRALIRKAEAGDVQAARLVLDHPVSERRDVLGCLDRDMRAMVRGWITGDESALEAMRSWAHDRKEPGN